MSWTNLYLAFSQGLDLSKDAVLSGQELQVAENVDWDGDGVIKGRPSRVAPGTFNWGGSQVTFASTGLTPRGLFRLRDSAGERPGLACDGAVFSYENGRWANKGGCASAKADRPVNFAPSTAGTTRLGCTPDFGPSAITVSGFEYDILLTPELSQDRIVLGAFGAGQGTGARCGTTTAKLFLVPPTAFLEFEYRTNGGDTLTTVSLASDGSIPSPALSPVICCSNGGGSFWAIYKTTTTDQYKILRIGITGTVLATFTGTFTGLSGFWLDNTAPGTNKLAVALTSASGGLTLKVLDATTLADLSLTSTVSSSTGGTDCVVGCVSATEMRWAFRAGPAGGVGDGDLIIGTASLAAGSSATTSATYQGGGTYPNAAINWGIAHQPLVVGGRVYLTLVAAPALQSTTGTWTTLDITTTPWQLVAKGPSNATIPWKAAAVAVPLTTGTGWTFPTLDWSRFTVDATEALTGQDAYLGLNRVQLGPVRETLIGETTVLSGSVPHALQRGNSSELGFPFLAGQPGLDASGIVGGAVGIGSYTLLACWRWIDEAGIVHRSAPSIARTVNITGFPGTNTISCVITNPVLTEKVGVVIELYCTDINPTDDAPHFLQKSVAPDFSLGQTSTVIQLNVQPVTTTLGLYTDGNEFPNYHVSGDGGVAALGRRLWMATGSTVYASKLVVPGKGPGFNDQGQLQINLPAGAGRIVSLEAMDDKLVIFCSTGVYVIGDGGPDNTGQGLDFGTPQRMADLPVAGARSTCWTSKGIVFVVPYDNNDPQLGGPWLLSRGLDPQYLGLKALDFLKTQPGFLTPELAYVPERDAVFLTFNDNTDLDGTDGVVMMDLRTGRWSTWRNRDLDGPLRSVIGASGHLWSLADEPAPLSGAPGTDYNAGAYAMRLRTSHLYSNGQSGFGWARVRGVRVLGTPESGTHTLTMKAILDQVKTHTSSAFSMTPATPSTTWPTSRQGPEWRLPSQKCASIQIELAATPATARWAAVAMQVLPLPPTTPAAQRA